MNPRPPSQKRWGPEAKVLSESAICSSGRRSTCPTASAAHQVLRIVRSAHLAIVHVQQWAGPIRNAAQEQTAIQKNIRLRIRRAEGDDFAGNDNVQFPQSNQGLALHYRPIESLLFRNNRALART